MKKIIVAITGASGSVYAVDLLKKLKSRPDVEVHGVVSRWAWENLRLETSLTQEEVIALMDVYYEEENLGAAIASGSFLTDGMVIVPASMKTVAGIAHGFSETLIGRAADVILKEQRRLVIVPRETPLSVIHLENLTKLARLGVVIAPPMPAFYTQPQTISDLVSRQTDRLLDLLGLPQADAVRWQGEEK
ncbi:UbiX family flavin prenyltransferase [Enterococcus sp. AD013-P3]|uniref:UbiX family flavin prenyltransferase n=1 Tax=Enterococcus sp. AD013-P3 TaxID=3411036 RepID=UPI003B943C46